MKQVITAFVAFVLVVTILIGTCFAGTAASVTP